MARANPDAMRLELERILQTMPLGSTWAKETAKRIEALLSGAPTKKYKHRPNTVAALRKDLRTLIDYNWEDEQLDFAEFEGDAAHHVFTALVRLDNWLEDTDHSPESHVRS